MVKRYATAELRGGQINYITSLQYVGWVGRDWVEPFIEIFCRDYDDSNPSRITGTWNVDNDDNGLWDTFNIQLQNQNGYSPVIDNIKFTIIPEPASLALLAFGGLLMRSRKK